MDTLMGIISNAILLFGMLLIVSLSRTRTESKSLRVQVAIGILLGAITLFIMMSAKIFSTGVIYDTRTVILTVTAYLFSPITSLVTAAIALIYRISFGGIGVYAGSASILISFLIGYGWKVWIKPKCKKLNPYPHYFLLGLLSYLGMIGTQFILPHPINLQMIEDVWLAFLIVQPVAVMLLIVVFENHDESLKNKERLEESERRYITLIEQSQVGILQYDIEGIIVYTNQAFAHIMDTTQEKLIGLDMKTLPNKKLVQHVLDSLDNKITVYEDIYVSMLSGRQFPTRTQFAPVLVNKQVTGGIAICEDLSQTQDLSDQVNLLQQYDILTGLLNRSSFDEFLLGESKDLTYPLSIVTCDINALQIINESFGYEVGNKVLIEMANMASKEILHKDNIKMYRIGGDEFAAVVQGQSKQETEEMVYKLRNIIQNSNNFDFKISISCGISTDEDYSKPLVSIFNESLGQMMRNKILDDSTISHKTIDVIMNTLFEKSTRERLHSERVSQIAKGIAKHFHKGEDFVRYVELAGRLHDIGKINIAQEILDKPSRLTDEEYMRIKKHAETGFKILSSVKEYQYIASIVLSHHEWVNGQGYPNRLSKNDIPLESKIISVADAFDAMIVKRPYAEKKTPQEALEELEQYRDIQFDPEVLDKFKEYYKEFLKFFEPHS